MIPNYATLGFSGLVAPFFQESHDSIEEFAEQVRETLLHLNDYVRPQSCPLCSFFFPAPSLEGSSRAQRFRRLLVEIFIPGIPAIIVKVFFGP